MKPTVGFPPLLHPAVDVFGALDRMLAQWSADLPVCPPAARPVRVISGLLARPPRAGGPYRLANVESAWCSRPLTPFLPLGFA